ncbi:hypothetical protein KTO58_07965 [Chitinophaga pendula]|uniref:hypothetical protein n=1 Tax=Chitinophaga TaxID=79328 RepID=UPI000BB054FC|nr:MULTISPECIES: hypothetical protein [Chitinophaga]ASZ13271.1 hypothetical protein CK934_21050 [Chitinophaga sp. MD30]UCJ09106.1 hypothetical protein KTO58_07965 [Chitinophaga pendula]
MISNSEIRRMNIDLSLQILAKDARSFYDAYMELAPKQEKLFKDRVKKYQAIQEKARKSNTGAFLTGHDMDFSSPAFMCLSFSLELHIKLLLRLHGIEKTGHDISKLINALPTDEKELLSMSKYLQPTQQGENFFTNLVMISQLFIRLRYYFEKLGALKLDPWFTISLIKTIQERAAEICPELKYDLGLL